MVGKTKKRILSLLLAFGLAVTSVPMWQAPVTVQAAAEEVTIDTVRQEARDTFESDRKAFDIDLSGQTFDGTTGVDYSSNTAYMEVLNNLRQGNEDQTLIMRFKTTQTGLVLLFGAGVGGATDGSDMVIGLNNGKLRFSPRVDVSGLVGTIDATLNDGNYHTMALSFLPSKGNTENNLRIVIDGGEDIYGTHSVAGTWYQRFVPGFNQQSGTAYAAMKVGGTGFKVSSDAMGAFNGSMEYVTLINKSYTVEELQSITAVPTEIVDPSLSLDTVREEARTLYGSSKAFDMDLSGETFNGSGVNYSSNTGYMQVLNNLRQGTDDQTLILRFKTTQNSGLVHIFGTGTSPTATDGTSMIVGLSSGKIRIIFRNNGKNTDGEVDTSQANGCRGTLNGSGNLADGEYHTVAISFLPSLQHTANNVRVVIDGGSELYESTGWYENWLPGFNQQPTVEYKSLEIGTGAYKDNTTAMSALTGSVDSITLINKAYTVAELQKITEGDKSTRDSFSVMTESGSRNTWLFTGGTEAVADFSTSGMTRNFVGMFEDKLRESGTYVERGRFVFNLAKKGADVASVLANYDTMIEPYGTKAVGIVVGASDYTRGTAGVAAFKTALKSLLDRIYEEDKLPFIITPYPSKDSSAAAQITAYVEAINEVAAKRTRVVNISALADNLVQADGSLSPSGHQTVANTIKSTLGAGTATSFTYNLASGSYTVAKKAADGSEAQVKEVTAGADSVRVRVDAASISGSAAQLSYVLTDSEGQKISGSAPAGQTEFTVGGLKQGETYTLSVSDESRGAVKETYRPVSITVSDGAKGVSQAYADGNVSVNEKIKSLLTSKDPVTYLFMGDSITHGVLTEGYDNVPMLFKKYLNELDRTEDVVLNTGVTNATIATTLDQIDKRLEQYDPDVVIVMLGTNDCATNGENTANKGTSSSGSITVQQYKDRYKELVRKIHDNNAESSVVLRVPCAMSGTIGTGQNRNKYEEYFAVIPDVAEEMRQEILGLNIVVVDHLTDWRNYRDNVRNDNIASNASNNYSGPGWLVNDGVHPNGRGNVAMFQQIIKELGLYVNTSEMANYQYALTDWTDTSTIAAAVTQEGSTASFAMSALSGYTAGLKDVTVTLTDTDGKSFSKTAAYDASGTIILTGLDAAKTYTAAVTGKDAANSKAISFAASLNRDVSQEEINAARAGLKGAIDAAKAGITDSSAYTESTYQVYSQKLSAAESAYAKTDATLAELQTAKSELEAAKNGLKTKEEADKETAKRELEAAITAAEREVTDSTLYTTESYQNYTAKLEAAKTASANASATSTELQTAKSELEAAKNSLKTKEEADKETEKNNLDKKIEEVTGAVADSAQYTPDSYQVYADALKKAQDIFADADATLEQIQTAQSELEKAAKALKTVSEFERENAKKALGKEIAGADALYKAGQQNYTAETWQNFVKAYEAAKAVGADADAAALDKAASALKTAKAALTVKASADQPPVQQPPTEKPVQDGQVCDAGNYSYKVTSTSKLTVEVVGLKNADPSKITIYNTVTIQGKKYKVTSVAASAFKNNKKVTSVSTGKNVETIGNNAFAGCAKLKKVTIKSTKLKKVGNKTFLNCKKLKNITIKSKVLKKVGKNAFKGTAAKLVIKVPAAKRKAYKKLLAKKGQSKTAKIK